MGITLFVPQLCFRGSSPSPSDTRTCRVWSNVVFEEIHCGLVWIRRYVIPCTIQIRYLIAAIPQDPTRRESEDICRILQISTSFGSTFLVWFLGRRLHHKVRCLGYVEGMFPVTHCELVALIVSYQCLLSSCFPFWALLAQIGASAIALNMRRRAGSCGGGEFFRHSTNLNGLTVHNVSKWRVLSCGWHFSDKHRWVVGSFSFSWQPLVGQGHAAAGHGVRWASDTWQKVLVGVYQMPFTKSTCHESTDPQMSGALLIFCLEVVTHMQWKLLNGCVLVILR